MVKVQVKGSYSSRFEGERIGFEAGAIVEVSPELAAFLKRDAPDNFVFGGKAVAGPPENKMVEGADFDKMTVPQLKQLLSAKELPVSGTKAELIERLQDA